jgi:DNA polymerase (family X)
VHQHGPLMVPLDIALRSLATVAALRGHGADADALRTASERLAHGLDAQDHAVVRDALAMLREDGVDATLRNALAGVAADLRQLVDAGQLSLADVELVHASSGAVTAGDLADAVASGALDAVPGLAERVSMVLPLVKGARRPTPLGRAVALLEPLTSAIRDADATVEEVTVTGSARRFATYIGDLEVLAATPDPARTAARLTTLALGTSAVLHASPATLVLRFERAEVTIRLVRPDAYAAMLVHLTGSPRHVAALRARALRRGLRFTRAGLFQGGASFALATEQEVYEALGLPFIPPELREDDEAIEAAERGALPALVTTADIRGDLHVHTDWSDGRDSLEAMVIAAEALGYEYVAITDHSKSALVARGLDAERLDRQRAAIEEVRRSHPGITILHGSEVDIRHDGSLDFPDAVLERLDIVLASLHDAGADSGARLTERYLAAIRHPLVNVITHPTNQLVPGRGGYELDERRIFEAAAETGTFLEIDGAPSHLDMDGPMARRAAGAGVTVAIDSDCHRAEWLGQQMGFGVALGRRGWIEARQVANTQSVASLRARVGRKRAGGSA